MKPPLEGKSRPCGDAQLRPAQGPPAWQGSWRRGGDLRHRGTRWRRAGGESSRRAGPGRREGREEAVREGGPWTPARPPAPRPAPGPSSLPSPSAPPGRRTCSLSAGPATSPAKPAPPGPAARQPPSLAEDHLGKEGQRRPPPDNNRQSHWKTRQPHRRRNRRCYWPEGAGQPIRRSARPTHALSRAFL